MPMVALPAPEEAHRGVAAAVEAVGAEEVADAVGTWPVRLVRRIPSRLDDERKRTRDRVQITIEEMRAPGRWGEVVSLDDEKHN